jgi:hypothetical protein
MRSALHVGVLLLAATIGCAADPATAPADARTPATVLLGERAAILPLTPGVVETVMRGLDSPRGMTFGPEGALYVAEAGRGPTAPACFAAPATCACAPGANAAMPVCYGPTGAVSRLWRGVQERVVTGLPSYANVAGRAEGPNDVAMLGRGIAHVTIGLEQSPFERATSSARHPEFAQFGTVARVLPNGGWEIVADLAAYEQAHNPDPRIYDSNPYGLLALPGMLVATDAGGNSILALSPSGEISTLAVMPLVPASNSGDAVPTSIVVGPDGAWYVGVLAGAPWRAGSASVYRLVPGEAPVPRYLGFKTIIDIAFDANGRLYVLQHSSGLTGLAGAGMLLRVSADGAGRDTLLTDLVRPTSVAIAGDGTVYVTNRGLTPGSGEVLRIAP